MPLMDIVLLLIISAGVFTIAYHISEERAYKKWLRSLENKK